MAEEEPVSFFEDFFYEKMKDEIDELKSEYPKNKKSLNVDFAKLYAASSDVANALLENPDGTIKAAETALEKSFRTLDEQKIKAHVRFYNLKDDYEVDVQKLGAEHLNKLFRVRGVVNWIKMIQPLVKTAAWRCARCGELEKTVVEKGVPKQPAACSKCGNKGYKGAAIMVLDEANSEFINVQRAGLQESVEKLRGSAPVSIIELWLEDDLVNLILPGEKITATCILRLKPQAAKSVGAAKARSGVYDKFLDVVHVYKEEREFEEITISKEEEKEIREMAKDPQILKKITHSIAPRIYGYDELKQAIALQLFGGTPNKILPDKGVIRSDMHILLVGDPGTAKSVTLEYVSRLAPKSVFVSGGGTSGVGLTAAAERDPEGGWILKAGAMVLANGGVAVIDEFDKMNEEDRGLMHQAMEQQIVSIAKAGIVTQFHAKTAVLAAANPQLGRFDATKPPAQQFNISPALMSRFDLIFTIRDVIDEKRDREMAEHILLGHEYAANKNLKPPKDSALLPDISIEVLQKYIAYARKNVHPVIGEEAKNKIKDFYIEMRKLGKQQENYPVTARQIEAIIRLAEAFAKVRLSERVELSDADNAISLINYVLHEVFMDKETGRIDTDVIYIGQPKSKTDKMRSVMEIISSLEKKFDVVSKEDVVREAIALGIDGKYAEQLIDLLLRQGDLYTPKLGFIKSARKKWE